MQESSVCAHLQAPVHDSFYLRHLHLNVWHCVVHEHDTTFNVNGWQIHQCGNKCPSTRFKQGWMWAVYLSPYWSLIVDSQLSIADWWEYLYGTWSFEKCGPGLINVTLHCNIYYKQTSTFVLIEDCRQWVLRCRDQPTFRDGLGTLSMLFSCCARPETKRCHILHVSAWRGSNACATIGPNDIFPHVVWTGMYFCLFDVAAFIHNMNSWTCENVPPEGRRRQYWGQTQQ